MDLPTEKPLEGVTLEFLNTVPPEDEPGEEVEFAHHGRGEVGDEVRGEVQVPDSEVGY